MSNISETNSVELVRSAVDAAAQLRKSLDSFLVNSHSLNDMADDFALTIIPELESLQVLGEEVVKRWY